MALLQKHVLYASWGMSLSWRKKSYLLDIPTSSPTSLAWVDHVLTQAKILPIMTRDPILPENTREELLDPGWTWLGILPKAMAPHLAESMSHLSSSQRATFRLNLTCTILSGLHCMWLTYQGVARETQKREMGFALAIATNKPFPKYKRIFIHADKIATAAAYPPSRGNIIHAGSVMSDSAAGDREATNTLQRHGVALRNVSAVRCHVIMLAEMAGQDGAAAILASGIAPNPATRPDGQKAQYRYNPPGRGQVPHGAGASPSPPHPPPPQPPPPP